MGQRYSADVVIIGGGIAGIVTAIEAARAGKSILILERLGPERFGGSAREAFGGLFFVDSPEQRRLKIRDSVELAFGDWESFAQWDEDEVLSRKWAEVLVARSTPDGHDWLKTFGIGWLPVVLWVERGLHVRGNSVPRFHLTWGTGRRIATQLIAGLNAIKGASITVKTGHRVDRLDTRGGAVVGCSGVVEADGSTFEASGACVVVAAGGIGGDVARVRSAWRPGENVPAPERILLGTHPSSDGRVLDAATQAGAQLAHLGRMWNYAAGVHHPRPDWVDHGVSLIPPKSAMWVDATGRRIGPEPLVSGFDTNDLVRHVSAGPHGYSWQILNRRIALKELAASGADWNPAIRERRPIAFARDMLLGNRWLVDDLSRNCPDVVVGRTVEELVQRMNAMGNPGTVDAGVLAKEIAAFDATLGDVKDKQRQLIERLRAWRGDKMRLVINQKILEPKSLPLVAIREFVVTRKSLGGIVTDLQSRAVDANGAAIPGLYAVGEAAGFGGGGSHGHRALEGTFLLSCVITGRRAAESIVHGR